MKRLPFVLFFLLALRADAAMVRVLAIENGSEISIERNGGREVVHLAGVAITDELRAAELLRGTIGSSWILLESAPGGGALVYRSPDALFVNRELVVRGYARATLAGIAPSAELPMTYLGLVDPAGVQSRVAPRATQAPAPRTGSGTGRRSRAPRKPRPPARGRAAPGID